MDAKQNTSEIMRELNSSAQRGLSTTEAEARLEKYGPNQLKEQKKKGIFMLFLEQLCDPLIYVLMAAIAISLFLKEAGDAAIIGAVILLNSVVGVIHFIQKIPKRRLS